MCARVPPCELLTSCPFTFRVWVCHSQGGCEDQGLNKTQNSPISLVPEGAVVLFFPPCTACPFREGVGEAGPTPLPQQSRLWLLL